MGYFGLNFCLHTLMYIEGLWIISKASEHTSCRPVDLSLPASLDSEPTVSPHQLPTSTDFSVPRQPDLGMNHFHTENGSSKNSFPTEKIQAQDFTQVNVGTSNLPTHQSYKNPSSNFEPGSTHDPKTVLILPNTFKETDFVKGKLGNLEKSNPIASIKSLKDLSGSSMDTHCLPSFTDRLGEDTLGPYLLVSLTHREMINKELLNYVTQISDSQIEPNEALNYYKEVGVDTINYLMHPKIHLEKFPVNHGAHKTTGKVQLETYQIPGESSRKHTLPSAYPRIHISSINQEPSSIPTMHPVIRKRNRKQMRRIQLNRSAFKESLVNFESISDNFENGSLSERQKYFSSQATHQVTSNNIDALPQKNLNSLGEIFNFDEDVFLNKNYSIIHRKKIKPLVSFIESIRSLKFQPTLTPVMIYWKFCDFSKILPTLLDDLDAGYVRNNKSFRSKPRSYSVFDKLIPQKNLWFKFWKEKTGINLETIEFKGSHLKVQERAKDKLVLLIFYIDTIRTILRRFDIPDNSDTIQDDNSLLKKAMNIIHEFDAAEFQSHKFKGNALNSDTSNSILTSEDPTGKLSFLWNWIETLITSYGNPKISNILFYNGNGHINHMAQRVLNQICLYSIDQLNHRLSIRYKIPLI